MSVDGPSPELHRLLQRQLRRLGLRPGVPPDAETWDRLLERVSQAYAEADDERYLMERSESLASTEMASLNEALKRARDSAEALASVKATFLANMSHEIRTPLNAVLGMAYLALQADPSPRQRDYLDKIRKAGQHLLGIINDILDFSKIEAGRLQVERVVFDLDQTLESVLSMVADRARTKGLALSLEVADGVPARLLGDPQKLRQILINYLNNAVKFTEVGGVSLRVSAGLPDEADGVPMRFEVRDTGIGVAPDEVERIFRSFEQADASTTRRYGGTGLGLAISRRLAELMEGSVGVVSQSGQGSTFWLEVRFVRPSDGEGTAGESAVPVGYQVRVVDERLLDHAPGRDSAALAPASAGAAPLAGARVLLVEDNELNQQVASELLRALGVAVDIAQDGREAIERLMRAEEGRYGLVLMDVHMPVMDGIEATGALRAMPRFAGIPIVAMTASVLPEERQRVLDAGMNALLPKPVDPPELEACLRRWLTGGDPVGKASSPAHGRAGIPLVRSLPAPVDGLDADTGLRRCGGDPGFYHRMLRDFVARWSAFPAKARSCVAQRDWARLHREAHSLKGVCGTVGAQELRDLAERLEHAAGRRHAMVAAARTGPGEIPDQGHDEARADALARADRAVTDAIDPLETALSRLVAGLRSALDRTGSESSSDGGADPIGDAPIGDAPIVGGADGGGLDAAPPRAGFVPADSLDAAQLGRALDLARRALTLLESSELVVVQYIEAERDVFRAWMGHDRFLALDDALREYDLERAAAVLAAAARSLERTFD